MRTRTIGLVVAMVTAVFGAGELLAVNFGTEITISDDDGVNGYGSWYQKSHEDNEVEPFAATGQRYDMEGFFLDGDLLTMVGGYNFWNYPTGMRPGDLFVGLGEVLYGDSILDEGYVWDDGQYIPNVFGYDYVFDLKFGTGTYDLYAISEETHFLKSINSDGLGESNPWRYCEGGDYLGSGDLTYWNTPLDDDDLEGDASHLVGGDHYAVQINLSVLNLAPDTEFTAHFTEKCGNDNLMGKGNTDIPSTPLPDGGSTLILMGAAIIAAAGTRKLSQ